MKLVKITKANIELLNAIMDLIFDEWGESFSCSKEEKLNRLKTPILTKFSVKPSIVRNCILFNDYFNMYFFTFMKNKLFFSN